VYDVPIGPCWVAGVFFTPQMSAQKGCDEQAASDDPADDTIKAKQIHASSLGCVSVIPAKSTMAFFGLVTERWTSG
jgi:hypothetical protein